MTNKVLIVAAHADDEVLGCGGTIAKHCKQGDDVKIIFMADGVGSRQLNFNDELAKREDATKKALKILGVDNFVFLGFPDNRMDSLSLLNIVQPLEQLIYDFKPKIIYTHHYGDLNVDHRLTHQAVMTACRPQPEAFVKEIYTFEVMSSTEWASVGLSPFLPNVFIDISETLCVKEGALNAYELEMRASPHSRSIENLRYLASSRGHMVGVSAAEAFMLMRSLK